MEDILHLDMIRSNKTAASVVDRTVAVLKLAAFKAAANRAKPKSYPLPADAKSFEQLLAARLASRPALAQAAAVKWATRLAADPVAQVRLFGALAKVDVRSARPVAELAQTAAPLVVNRPQLEQAAQIRFADDLIPGMATPPQVMAASGSAPAGKVLKIRIHRVICEDETDGFLGSESGDDEIGIGGVTVDETGDVHKVSPWTVGTEFDDGEKRVYSPPKTFEAFSLAEGGNHWPKSYAASIYLSELDNGGFPSFVNELYNEVKKYIGALVNGWIPGLGALVVMVLDVFFGWLVSIWEDDLFPAITIQTDIKSPQHVFASGTRTSSIKKYWTKAHGGKYWVWLDWQITS
jgi:hypothetical protein